MILPSNVRQQYLWNDRIALLQQFAYYVGNGANDLKVLDYPYSKPQTTSTAQDCKDPKVKSKSTLFHFERLNSVILARKTIGICRIALILKDEI
jgi:hypothetical protein